MPKERHLRQTTLFNYNRKTPSAPTPARPSRPLPSRRKHDRAREPESSNESSESQAIKVEPKPSGSLRIAEKRRKVRPIVDDSSEEDVVVASANDEDSSSMAKVASVSRGKRSRRMRLESSNSDSDSDLPVKKKPVRRQIQEVFDEEEDLEEEVDKDSILPTRFRARGKKTAFQKSLEKLKRKKLKEPAVSPSESSGENKEEEIDHVKPIRGAKPRNVHDDLFSGDSDGSDASSDFVIEDDSAVRQELPAQFSMQTHQDLSCQFKNVFQFFVHIAVRAPRERHQFMTMQMRDEEYFSIPLKMMRRKLMGLRDSLVASSAWKPEFKMTIEKYPEFELTELSYAQPGCDACHIGSRRSTLIGRVTGFPYDCLGFETIDEDSEDEDEKREFNLGRFCAKRTRVYHELTHWENTLFKCIREEVDDLHATEQSKGFIRVAYAGRKQPPDDLGDADGIFEWLDDCKIVDMEWRRVKDVLESARHLDAFSKEDVD